MPKEESIIARHGQAGAPICWNWQDMSLFLKWDLGYDYYNSNYQNKSNRIQFAFVGTVF